MTATESDPQLDNAFELFEKGRLDDAEKQLQHVLAREPESVLGLHLLAIIAAQTKREPMAISLLRQVTALEPHSSEALSDLGHLLRIEGNLPEAIGIFERACQADPLSSAARNGLGEAYLAADRPENAEICFRRAIELSPELAVPVYNLGIALQAQGREREAAAEYRKAISFDPALSEPYMRLGNLLRDGGERDEALALFRRVSELQPEATSGRICRATLLFEQGQIALAEECLRAALVAEPDNVEVLYRLGDVLTRSGHFEGAVDCFSRAIAMEPRRVEAYAGIANAKTMIADDRPVIEGMLSQLERRHMAAKDRAILHFAIAKTFDDLADYESAMRHYDEGNRIEAQRLRIAGRTLDPEQHAASVERLIQTFTPDFFARHERSGSPSELPVLIIGMPRSGTTLVEQILSSHPRMGAGDELTFWGEKCAAIAEQGHVAFTAADAQRLAHEYLALLQNIDKAALRVTDKMPQNFLHLGLAHLVFPKARIIHCRRNPIDTCLSIYFTHFALMRDFAFDRASIVSFYEQYLKLVAHWRNVLPEDRFLEIDYEQLVADPEPMARKMIAYCGLDWNDSCLRSEQNKRTITTASMWQARQPVYTKSAGRWRRYEPWLGEFRHFIPQDIADVRSVEGNSMRPPSDFR